MVDIVGLEATSNMRLTKGAAQHWSFGDRAMPSSSLWESLVVAHAGGRCLIVGVASDPLLQAVDAVASEVAVVTWAIPDAARAGRTLPHASVHVGDLAALVSELGEFDTVVCADLATVLSLESQSRPWAEVFTEVRSFVGTGGRLLLAVENDLGPHRITASHNPRSQNADADWAPLATWDPSRPRSTAQVQALGPDAVWTLGPGWPEVTVAWQAGAGGDLAAALALRAAAWPIGGPDPAWLMRSSALAGRLDDSGAAWLGVFGPPADLPSVLIADEEPLVERAAGVSLLQRVADAAAADDTDSIRSLLAAWAAGVRAHPEAAVDLGAWVLEDESLTPLVRGSAPGSAWAGLVDLIRVLRARNWRHPWPSTTSDEDLLAILGAMAGLEGPPSRDARDRLTAAMDLPSDHFSHLDRQQLVAAIDRNNETIRALRSRVSWVEKQLEQARRAQLPAAYVTARRYAGQARRLARKAAARGRSVLGPGSG